MPSRRLPAPAPICIQDNALLTPVPSSTNPQPLPVSPTLRDLRPATAQKIVFVTSEEPRRSPGTAFIINRKYAERRHSSRHPEEKQRFNLSLIFTRRSEMFCIFNHKKKALASSQFSTRTPPPITAAVFSPVPCSSTTRTTIPEEIPAIPERRLHQQIKAIQCNETSKRIFCTSLIVVSSSYWRPGRRWFPPSEVINMRTLNASESCLNNPCL